jgi:hypothetical protein
MLGQTKNAVGGCQSAIGLIRPIRLILKSPISILKSFSVPRHAWPVAKYEFAALAHKMIKPLQGPGEGVPNLRNFKTF